MRDEPTTPIVICPRGRLRMLSFPVSVVLTVCVVTLAGCNESAPLVTSLPQYHGKTRQAVEATLGAPTRFSEFPMSRATDEMRHPLTKTYPTTNPANANVIIQECSWKDGDYWITLWFHQLDGAWVVLESCRWQKDVKF